MMNGFIRAAGTSGLLLTKHGAGAGMDHITDHITDRYMTTGSLGTGSLGRKSMMARKKVATRIVVVVYIYIYPSLL